MRVWNLDQVDDGCDIEVFIPGPPGPPRVDVGSRPSPIEITGSIAAPVNRLQRTFVVGSSGPIFNPAIPNPADNGAWDLILFGTSDDNTITLESQSNIQLSGQCILSDGSVLNLEWDGTSKYVENYRNEI